MNLIIIVIISSLWTLIAMGVGFIIASKIFIKKIKSNITNEPTHNYDADYSEDKILAHLDYIIKEALDEYVLLHIEPKQIYYITNVMENDIRKYVSDEIPKRISPTLIHQLKYIYSKDHIPAFLGTRIYMTVLNYVIEFNLQNYNVDKK